ncbi:mRNA surveillance protein pelota [Halohasta salina]|uniref:mRNA surveillance protein pelota n=1 Tax=Halohasta salina TaxID=2961621 RepID=UPI0020A36368|nr:mRNA surveillance protein pelota [Halohasta salina]
MRIASRGRGEAGRERLTLVPETVDDLWHLSYVLEPGDLVSGDTTRRIQRNDDQMRDTGGQREHLSVTLEVESVEFARFANRLRVGGVITGCSREDQLGLHHTLNVEPHEELTIEKRFKPDQIERIEDAEAAADNPEVAVATVEEGEAYIHLVKEYGVEEYASFTKPTGKGEYSRPRAELFGELGDALSHLEVAAIILAGPGFTKQDAHDYIAEEYRDLADLITVVDTSAAGGRGVHEVLKRGAVEEVQDETRIAREAETIDELMERIADGAKAAYGIEAVAEATEFGAVEELLVLDERLREERQGDGEWTVDVNEVIKTVEQKGGEITVFSKEFQPGQQLKNLGGIAALLRYRLQ